MSYSKNLSGALFKNDRKEAETHPDYKGSCEINGVQYWVNSWLNTSDKGVKYLSLKFKAKDEAPKQERQQAPADDFSDAIPF